MRVENGYKYFFKPDNPYLLDYEKLQATYTKSDNILFTLTPASKQVFERDTLTAVEELTQAGWTIPCASRVDSLTNFQHSRGEEDDIVVRDLVQDPAHATQVSLDEAKQAALAEPLLLNALLSSAADTTGVNVNLSLPNADPQHKAAAVAKARSLAKEIEQRHPGLQVRLTGNAMLNIAFEEAAMQDMGTLTPLMYLVVLLVAGVFLRSGSGVFITLFVIALATAFGLGAAGYLGIPLTSPSAASLTVIMTLAVSEPVHVITAVYAAMRRGLSKSDAIIEALEANFAPLCITNVTTAIGFLSMNASDVQPFADLGNITTWGVLATFVLSVVTVPSLIALLPLRVPKEADHSSIWMRFAEAITGFVVRWRRSVLIGALLSAVVAGYYTTQNELDERFVSYFDHSTAFRRDTDFTMAHLTGLYRLEFSLSAGESGAVSDPAYLKHVDEFVAWYRAQPTVRHVSSYTDVIKRLNRNMHGEDPAFYSIPESRELAAQYNLLYEMSLPRGLDLKDMVDVDRSATRVVVTVDDISTTQLLALGARGERWLVEHTPAAMHARAVGQAVMFARMSETNIESMLIGTFQAMLLISATLVFALRSLRLGLLSLLPNVLPAVLTFGLWGVFVGHINTAMSAVASISLGIVVDDTVHFMSSYLRARKYEQLSPRVAIVQTLEHSGAALIVTTIVLVAGFLVLALSAFGLNQDMGRVTALVLGIGLSADLLLLPALLLTLDREPSAAVAAESSHAPASPASEFATASVADGAE